MVCENEKIVVTHYFFALTILSESDILILS